MTTTLDAPFSLCRGHDETSTARERLDLHVVRGVGTALTHPALSGLRRLLLVTRDAHALYARFGFAPLARPERFMEIHRPDVYETPGG